MAILNELKTNYKENLIKKYNLTDIPSDDNELLNTISRKKGFLLKGGAPDIERTAKSVIQDFRKNSFGKIILEKL